MDADLKRIDLEGTLAGHYLVVDTSKLDMGFLEDIVEGSMGIIRKVLSGVVTECSLPGDTMDAKIRGLKPRTFKDFYQPILNVAKES